MLETDLRQPYSPSTRLRLADEAAEKKRRRASHFDTLADERDRWKAKNAYYHRSIEKLCRRFIPPGSRVLAAATDRCRSSLPRPGPVRYAGRTAGVSKVRLISDDWLLLRMSWLAFRKLKWNRWLGRDPVEKTVL